MDERPGMNSNTNETDERVLDKQRERWQTTFAPRLGDLKFSSKREVENNSRKTVDSPSRNDWKDGRAALTTSVE